MLSSHTVGFQRPDNSNLANLTPGLLIVRTVFSLFLLYCFSDRDRLENIIIIIN